jgi:hypothetical protein
MGRIQIQSDSLSRIDSAFSSQLDGPVPLHKAGASGVALASLQDGIDYPQPTSWQSLGLIDRGDLAGGGGGRLVLLPATTLGATEPPWWLSNEGIRQWEAARGPQFDRWRDELFSGTSPSVVDAKLAGLEADLQRRYDRYLRLAGQATDPQMMAYYRDLYIAMRTDLNDLAGWKSLPDNDAKIERFNRVAYEASIEVKNNVALMTATGAKPWSMSDLQEIDRAFQKLPAKFTLESDRLWIIQRSSPVLTPKGSHAGEFDSGSNVISITDIASSEAGLVGKTVIHEIGHSRQPSPDVMERFKKIADWRLVGPQNLPALAAYSHGDWAQAKDLKAAGVPGLDKEDPARWFQISKTDGNAYIVPSQPPPNRSPQLVTPYSLSNPAEDFAETFMLYYFDREEMKKKFPDKLKFMEENFGSEGG